MSLVLDGSVAIAWCLEDENTPAIETVFQDIAKSTAIVPGIWWLEVANGLQMVIRRKQLSMECRNELLETLIALNIRTDTETARYAWTTTVRLADRFGLTTYDASYLELALRLNMPLATLDEALCKAAAASACLLFPL